MRKSDFCGKCGARKISRPCGATRCRTCTREWDRAYYHRSQRYRLKMREDYYKRTYGVSMADLERLLSVQNERCAICGRHWTDCAAAKRTRYEKIFLQHLYVDHDHDTGTVRGLLCNNCNSAIALFHEDVAWLPLAEAYLRRHKNNSPQQD